MAVSGLSLEITEGESICVLGATGSGKTTFALLTNAVLLPTKGRVIVDGMDTADKRIDVKEVRRRVGVVLQYPEHQFFLPTVEEEILYAPRHYLNAGREKLERLLKESLELLGIRRELLDRNPFELSGGEKRKVAIASILSYEPKYLVMDEPLVGLDPTARSQLLGFLKTLKRMGRTWVVISHDLDDFLFTTDRFLIFHNGRMVFDGDRTAFISNASKSLEEWELRPSTKLGFLSRLPKDELDSITCDEDLEAFLLESKLLDCEKFKR